MSHFTKAMKLVAPRIKGLSIAAQDNNGFRFGHGIGLRAAVELPQAVNVARGTVDRRSKCETLTTACAP